MGSKTRRERRAHKTDSWEADCRGLCVLSPSGNLWEASWSCCRFVIFEGPGSWDIFLSIFVKESFCGSEFTLQQFHPNRCVGQAGCYIERKPSGKIIATGSKKLRMPRNDERSGYKGKGWKASAPDHLLPLSDWLGPLLSWFCSPTESSLWWMVKIP